MLHKPCRIYNRILSVKSISIVLLDSLLKEVFMKLKYKKDVGNQLLNLKIYRLNPNFTKIRAFAEIREPRRPNLAHVKGRQCSFKKKNVLPVWILREFHYGRTYTIMHLTKFIRSTRFTLNVGTVGYTRFTTNKTYFFVHTAIFLEGKMIVVVTCPDTPWIYTRIINPYLIFTFEKEPKPGSSFTVERGMKCTK